MKGRLGTTWRLLLFALSAACSDDTQDVGNVDPSNVDVEIDDKSIGLKFGCNGVRSDHVNPS